MDHQYRAATPADSHAWRFLAGLTGIGVDARPLDTLLLVTNAGMLRRGLAGPRPRAIVVAMPPADRAVLETVARVRRNRDIPAVVLTRPEAVDDRLTALGLGLDAALADTLTPQEPLGRLHLLAPPGRPIRGEPAIHIAPGMELDLNRHELRRGSERIHLRPAEFRLLAVLAHNLGRACSRRELLAAAWGREGPIDSRTIDVHVRWLRAKIEPNPASPRHLVTIRGLGYRLDGPEVHVNRALTDHESLVDRP